MMVINPEKEALAYAIENAKPGSHITICSDVITEALEMVMAYKEKEEKFEFSPGDIPNIEANEKSDAAVFANKADIGVEQSA